MVLRPITSHLQSKLLFFLENNGKDASHYVPLRPISDQFLGLFTQGFNQTCGQLWLNIGSFCLDPKVIP